MSDEDELGFCDGDCGGQVGKNGWMVKTGEVDAETGLPWVKLYCDACHFKLWEESRQWTP